MYENPEKLRFRAAKMVKMAIFESLKSVEIDFT